MMIPVGSDQVWADDTGGDGAAVVLLHPGITDSTVWDPMLEHLEGLRVLRYDRRGYGQSAPATEEHRTVDDLVAVLDHCGVERAHLVGNSMGGDAALALAVTAPNRVASLTLLCPAIGGYPWPEPSPAEQELYAEFGRLVEAKDWPAVAGMALEQWCAAGADDYLRRQLLATTELEFVTGERTVDNPEQWPLVGTIAVPTTVVAALLDPPDSLQASLDLAQAIPGAELVRMDVDHIPQYRDPETVARLVRENVARG